MLAIKPISGWQQTLIAMNSINPDALMANLSRNAQTHSLSVHNKDNLNYDLIQSSEEPNRKLSEIPTLASSTRCPDIKQARESKPKLYEVNIIPQNGSEMWSDSDKKKSFNRSHSLDNRHIEVPKRTSYSNYVNTSLKKLTQLSTGLESGCTKNKPLPQLSTEGTWVFSEHTKACFRDEIIPFIKNLKDIFNNFNQYLVDELADVQQVFYQMEQAVEQHRLGVQNFRS
ncbi:hypothetical protein Tco_0308612 [Tanacetum coccineum]